MSKPNKTISSIPLTDQLEYLKIHLEGADKRPNKVLLVIENALKYLNEHYDYELDGFCPLLGIKCDKCKNQVSDMVCIDCEE